MAAKRWERLRKQFDPAFYEVYRRSHHWRRLRKQVLARADYTCMRCGRRDPHRDKKRGTRLHVHHRTYARIGEERYEDLAVLCRDCHRLAHRPLIWRMLASQGKQPVKQVTLGTGKIDTGKRLSRK